MSLVNQFNYPSISQANPGYPGQAQKKQNNLFNKFEGVRDFHQPPFASVVQVPIRQIMAEKAKTEQKLESPESKRRKEIFTLIGPSLFLLGGLSWLGRALPNSTKLSLFGKLFKANGSHEVVDNALQRLGSVAIGSGGFFLGANGILAGITSGQASMIIGNILQFIPSILLILLGKNKQGAARNIAVNSIIATGATFTVGFANEIRNKNKTGINKIQNYDMTRFHKLLNKDSNLTLAQRVTGTLNEVTRMTKQTIQDHIQLFKNLPSDIKTVGNAVHNKAAFKEWVGKPSADKSDLAALLMYAGALPVVLLGLKSPKIADNILVKVIKGTGLLLANLSLFSIALNRNDLRGKAPLLGVPMVVAGMAGKSPAMQGLGYVGESIDNLLFSDVAVNGLNTSDAKDNNSTNFNTTAVSSKNPFNKISLTN